MPDSYLQVFIPIIGLMLNVLIQVLSFRYILIKELLKTIILAFFIGLLGIVIFEICIFFKSSVQLKYFLSIFITNLVTYSALGYCYFHFINLGETARRIRLMTELYDAKAGLTMNEILRQYSAEIIIENRVKRLIMYRQIVYREGRYYIGCPLMLWITKIIIAMKIIICGKKSEFD